jgi:hypothetical protein
MKKKNAILVALLSTVICAPAVAQQTQDVFYVRGTVQTVKEGTAGSIDKAPPAALEFESGTEKFAIPYAAITSFRYHEESKFHLGVLPAIAVGMVTYWAKRSFVTISWSGENSVPQVVTLEASKSAVQGLVELMRARATKACKAGERGQIPQSCGMREYE